MVPSNPRHVQFQQQAELAHRMSSYYKSQFELMIEQLNARDGSLSDRRCLSLCVEALNMMLSTHDDLAQAVVQLTQPATETAAA